MLVSFQMLPEQPAPELLNAVALADELGYHGCYSADEIYHKDAWLLFAAAAQRTERIRLGPCVAPIYMREPTYVAQLAATLDELSGGRAEVVFGIGNIAMLEQYGVEWRGTRPIARLREAHQVMRTVLDDGAIDFKGDFYSYTGVTTAARPVQEHLPLKMGAMGGPKSMQLAGEIADGLHTACAYSPEALGYAVEHFRRRRRARRPEPGTASTSATPCSARSHRTARRPVALDESSRRSTSHRCRRRCSNDTGSSRNRSLPVTEAFAAGDVQRALEATPEEIADRIMVAGTPEDWVRWLTETYAPAGLNHALVSFTDPFTLRAWAGIEVEGLPDLGEQVRMVGEQVIPELSSL